MAAAALLTIAGKPPTACAEQVRRLEEVVVTAQRRTQSALDTPISLISFDRNSLDTLGITSIADIEAQSPSLVIDTFPSSNQTLRLYIRGIGVGDVQVTQDPAVGVYLDGVYLARSTGLASDVADLERIEVLRGPQGTLYGRNTTGGAVNLVTARPDPSELAFRQVVGAGNRNRLYAKSVLNLPLGEHNAVKLSALYDSLDGFIDNEGPGGDFGDRRSTAYRFDWRWQAGESLLIDYAWDDATIESHNYTPQAIYPGVPTGGPADAAILSSQRFVTYGKRRFDSLSTSVPLKPNDTDVNGHTLTFDWQLKTVRLKSITAYRELEDDSYIEFASGASEEYRVDFGSIQLGTESTAPLDFGSVRTALEQDQFSQELQVFGAARDNVDYVLGLYYFEEDARENWFPLHHIFSFPLIATDDTAYAVNIRAEDNRITNEALAAYAQVTWSPDFAASRLHLSVGWRYSRDEREVERIFQEQNYIDFGNIVLGPTEETDFSASSRQSFDDHSFTFIAEYDLAEDMRAYGKIAEAYKSGGFNTRDPDPVFFAEGFDEEKNTSIELGFKGELLSNQLRVNAAAFWSEFDDLQLNFLLPGGISDTRVLNSGEARISGIELSLLSTPLTGLLCSLDYAYLESDIDDVIDPFSGEPRSFTFPSAPRHTAKVSVDYRLPTFPIGSLALNVNYNYVDVRKAENPNLDRDQYRLLNARLTWSGLSTKVGDFSVGAWVKNALDDDYESFAIDNLPHASRAILWGETRTWGIDFEYEL